jgi:hypothetical protein
MRHKHTENRALFVSQKAGPSLKTAAPLRPLLCVRDPPYCRESFWTLVWPVYVTWGKPRTGMRTSPGIGERVTVKMSCTTDYVCSHTASLFGRYFTPIYTADSGRTHKCVSVNGAGLSGAVLHWRARRYFADWRSKPNRFVFFGRVCQCVVWFRATHINALHSFLYTTRKWLILRNTSKLVLCRMFQNVSEPILKYWKKYCT